MGTEGKGHDHERLLEIQGTTRRFVIVLIVHSV